MSKLSTLRLLEEVQARNESAQRKEKAQQEADALNWRKVLSSADKKEIADVITSTTAKVAELIELLQWYNKSEQWWHDYYYQPRWGYSQSQLKKIRPLKNQVTAWYFEIWEKLRIHDIGTEKQIQDYYSRIRYFKSRYHATELTSSSVRDFHESIQEMIAPILNKAFKAK